METGGAVSEMGTVGTKLCGAADAKRDDDENDDDDDAHICRCQMQVSLVPTGARGEQQYEYVSRDDEDDGGVVVVVAVLLIGVDLRTDGSGFQWLD